MNTAIKFIKETLHPIYDYLFPIRIIGGQAQILSRFPSSLSELRQQASGGQAQILSRFPRHCKIHCSGTGNSIYIGTHCIIEHTDILISGNNNRLNIEDNFCLRKGRIIIEGNNCSVYIKKGTTIRGAEIVAGEDYSSVTIGEDCMFSDRIHIRTTDGHPIYDLEHNRTNSAGHIEIGNHVWVAQSACILKGAKIGDNSIIGMCAVVTHTVPSNCITAGIPAKVIKTGIIWERTF